MPATVALPAPVCALIANSSRLIFTQGQHAGVGLEKRASALHDQIERWFKTNLGADLLADLIERGHFRDFPLQGALVPLECSRHVIERLRKSSNLVPCSDADNNVALSSGYLVRSIGQAADGTR